MEYITEHNIKIIDINYKLHGCLVERDGRQYGCLLREHDGQWYFSIDDRCVWYLVKDDIDDTSTDNVTTLTLVGEDALLECNYCFKCDNCGGHFVIDSHPKYCPCCGLKVKRNTYENNR